ncbi:MAG TPA: serine/threonine-protein kinase [Gemmatimonadaceae bacterium]
MHAPHEHPLIGELRRALAGRYDVDRLLGAGGMGSVFLGRDPTLDRPVAIKVVDPELSASRAIRERFLQEARTVARLRHPNIVAVHAAGEADGLLWFVMEYVEGESLRDLLEREGCCSDGRGRSILRDVADALAYAHAQGIVHRDIKPDNILIERGTGRAMVTDFGVARALAAGDERLTGTGLVVGSPRYMSPEQASGEREVDGRSDVYSLGLVGYEMYAGEPAISASSGPTLIVKQITEKPAPLATRASDVPPEVAAAIDRALEKDPAARWQSAAEMSRALASAAWISGSTTAGAGVRPAGRRRRLAVAAVALGAVVAIAGGVLVSRGEGAPSGVDPRMSYFVAPFDVLGGDPQLEWLREGSVSMLTLNLAQWADLSVVDYERTLDILRDAGVDEGEKLGLEEARSIARDAGVWTVVMGRVTSTPDSLIVLATLYDVATGKSVNETQRSAPLGADPRPVYDALARDLLDISGAPAITLQLAKTTTSSVEAYRSYLEGVRALHAWRLDEADSLFRHATRADSTFALAYYKHALTYGWRSAGDTAQRGLIDRALRHSARLPDRERDIVAAYDDLVTALTTAFTGDTARQRAAFTAAQRKYEAIVQRDPAAVEAWYGLGDSYYHDTRQDPQAFAANWSRALRAFDHTLALDSTFHLAYSHKLDIYRRASAVGSGIRLDGDSLRLIATDSALAAFGGEAAEEAARERARRLAVRDARLWIRTDPVPQPYQLLFFLYAESGQPDSAIAVLREAMARPSSHWDRFAFYIAGMQARTDPHAGLETLRAALRETTAEELRREYRTDLFGSILNAAAPAAITGSLADVRATAELAAEAEPVAPGVEMARRPQALWYVAGVELAMGLPPEPRLVRLDSGLRSLERFPEPFGHQVRQFSIGMPYIGYLTSREPRYLELIRRWNEGTRTWPELDALEALAKGDTAAAREAAARFPDPDSARRAGIWLQVPRWIARAEVLQSLGDLRGALAMYEALDPRRFSIFGQTDPSWPYWPRSFLARGRLHEELGERERAAEAYERFLDLWKEADPALEPQKREAREGLERVRSGMAPRG